MLFPPCLELESSQQSFLKRRGMTFAEFLLGAGRPFIQVPCFSARDKMLGSQDTAAAVLWMQKIEAQREKVTCLRSESRCVGPSPGLT